MAQLGELLEVLRVLRAATDRRVRWRFGVGILLVVAGGLLSGLAPLALKHLVDAVADTLNSGHPMGASALALGASSYVMALCGGRLLTEFRPLVIASAEQRLHARLRQRFFGHVLHLRMAFHLEQRTGALIQVLEQATTGYQLIVVHLVNSIVPVLIEVATATVVLLHLGQPALMATFVATAFAYLVVHLRGGCELKERAQAVSSAALNAHAVLTDALLNFETIKCFGAEATARGRVAQASAELEHGWLALHRQRVRIGLAATVAFTFSVTLSLAIAAAAVVQGSLTIGGFVLATVYMLQVTRPLEMLGAGARDVFQALQFIRPLVVLLRMPTETPESDPPLSDEQSDALRDATTTTDAQVNRQHPRSVSFRGVDFSYGVGPSVLNGLDLDIGAGRAVAIVGASGSGKSSVVRLLLRLYEPQAGRILLDDVPIDRLPVRQLRAMIGVVPQDTVLFNDTLAFNIGIGKTGARQEEIEHAARVAQLHDFISSLPARYDTPVGERGLRLSGGERQRIAIARTVLRRPLIYVFDEATSMLDVRTEDAILRNLKELSTACTTIKVAHRLSTVLYADEILVLDGGRVAERGSHRSLLARGGIYARLWKLQTREHCAST